MKILVVTASIDPASGGPTRSCKGLCRALSEANEDVTLLVLNGVHPFEDQGRVNVIYAEKTLLPSVISNLQTYSLVHIQGLWQWGLHKMACACRRASVPYIISPRGMLDPWALSVKRWKKRIAMFLYQWRDLKEASALHVTATMERNHVLELGLKKLFIIAPNGVQFPDILPERKVKDEGAPRIAVFLGRLHPGKGLLTLADAWAKVNPNGWIMRIIGPDNYGHKAEVIAKLDSLNIPHYENNSLSCYDSDNPVNKAQRQISNPASHWEFCQAVNDHEKWDVYRSADLLVHPSVSENFGITIAEGLYAGLPVICTKGTPWAEVEGIKESSSSTSNSSNASGKCGWWIDQGVDALAAALREATSSISGSLDILGQNGHCLILSQYTWPAIAKTMINGYKTIL